MRASDVLVEVRDTNLDRVGTITPQYLRLTANLRWCNVGEWTITLPGEHPMVPHLLTPGSGITVALYGMPEFSGPTTVPARKRDARNPDGTFTFSGVTDEIHLQDARAYPYPSDASVSAQAAANDVRTGPAETVMHEYVAANILPGTAPAGRIRGARAAMTAATDLARGGTIQRSPRFDPLLEVLQSIAVWTLGTDEPLGFRMVQVGGELQFQVHPAADRSDTVRLDVGNGTLTSEEVQQSGPAVTVAIVAGQGEGVDRTIIQRTSTASEEGEAAWGRVIEVFIDQRNTNDLDELQQAGDEALAASGYTATNVKVIPADTQTMQYARDWRMGDTVGVTVMGQPTRALVTGAAWLIDQTTCRVGVAIGDVTGFDTADVQAQRVNDLDTRVGRIERNAEVGVPDPAALALLNRIVNGTFRTNQRGYASGAALAIGAWAHDRWRAVNATSYTFTADATHGQAITLASGGILKQPIERANMPAGDYTAALDGTAQLRLYLAGSTPPAFATGPVTVTVDGSADVILEVQATGGTRTVSNVRVYPGTADPGYQPATIGDELRACLRYYYRFIGTAYGAVVGNGFQATTTTALVALPLPVPMRAAPTLAVATGLAWSDRVAFEVGATIALGITSARPYNTADLRITLASAQGAAYRAGSLFVNSGGTAALALDAEMTT